MPKKEKYDDKVAKFAMQKTKKNKQPKTDITDADVVGRIWERFWAMKEKRDKLGIDNILDMADKISLPFDLSNSSHNFDLDNLKKQLNSPMIFTAIQTVLSVVQDFNPDYVLRGMREEYQKAEILTEIFNYLKNRTPEQIERLYANLMTLKHGTAIWKEYYRSDSRKIYDIAYAEPGGAAKEYSEVEVEDKNDCYGELVDIRTFYIDENATRMDDARDACERHIMPFSTFQARFIPKYKKAEDVVAGTWFLSQYEGFSRTWVGDIGEDEVEVLEYWNRETDEFHLVANGVLLTDAKCSPNPYKHKELPYAQNIFFPRSKFDFYGIGIAEILANHSMSRDKLWNSIVKRMELSVNAPILKDTTVDLADGDEFWTPNKILEVTDVNASFKTLDIDPPNPAIFNTIQQLDQEAKSLIGADDPLTGMKSGGTATENAIAKESSLARIKIFVKFTQEMFLLRIGRLRLSNIQQFYPIPIRMEKIVKKTTLGKFISGFPQQLREKIPGKKISATYEPIYRSFPINKKAVDRSLGRTWLDKEGEKAMLLPEDYMGYYEVEIDTEPTLPTTKDLEKKQMGELIQGLQAFPMLAGQINWQKIAESYFRLYNLDAKLYLQDPNKPLDDDIELAEKENERMMMGEPIPGTKMPSPEHTKRHEALIYSNDFLELHYEIQNMLILHYTDELKQASIEEAKERLKEIRRMIRMQQMTPPQEEGQPPMEGMPQDIGAMMPQQPQDMGMPPAPTENEAMGMQPPQPTLEDTTGVIPPRQ